MQRITKIKRKFIYDRDENKCLKCGSMEQLTLDHIIPLCLLGTNDYDNLQTLCETCNQEKSDTIMDYRVSKEVPEVKKSMCIGECVNNKACSLLGVCAYNHELLADKHWMLNSKISPDGKVSMPTMINIFQEVKPPKVSGKDIIIDFAKERGIYHESFEDMTSKTIKKILKGNTKSIPKAANKAKAEKKKQKIDKLVIPNSIQMSHIIYRGRKCYLYCLIRVPISKDLVYGTRGYYDVQDEKIVFEIMGTQIAYYEQSILDMISVVDYKEHRHFVKFHTSEKPISKTFEQLMNEPQENFHYE